MKKTTLISIIATAVAIPSTSLAALVYVDAGYNGNTFDNLTSSATNWTVDPGVNPNGAPSADNLWGQRTSGPGGSAFGTGAWQATSTESAPTIRTEVTGLLANTTYTGLRVYFIGKEALGVSQDWFIDASIDGTTFTTLLDGSANANAVDNATGLGTAIPSPGSGDIRYYASLADGTTDGSGNLNIWIRQGTGATNRTVYDGIAYDTTPVPEPSAFILLGLSGLAIVLRRRKR